jgi:hypothetical protein
LAFIVTTLTGLFRLPHFPMRPKKASSFASRVTALRTYRPTPAITNAAPDFALAKGWLTLHESGTFVRFTQAGADLFA